MKKLIVLIVLSTLFIPLAKAQYARNEIGIFGGVSYYMGDLNPSKLFLMSRPAYGLIYRYNISPRFALKINGFYGDLAGSDAVSKTNVTRNLSFKSYITDISVQIELNFLRYITGHDRYKFSPYIFAGVSLFSFNPKAEYDGKWYALQPLGTEGQGTTLPGVAKRYSLTSIGLPFGIGVKYCPVKFMCIGLEWGYRKTFTDYIDDVSTVYADPVVLAAENGQVAAALADKTIVPEGESVNNTGLQRGNSHNKDWYSFAGIFIQIRIKSKNGMCDAYKKHPKIKVKYN
jgi:opacity protein-like surface antigen